MPVEKQCSRCRYAAICLVGGKVWVWQRVRSTFGVNLLEAVRDGMLRKLDPPCGLFTSVQKRAEWRGRQMGTLAWGETVSYIRGELER